MLNEAAVRVALRRLRHLAWGYPEPARLPALRALLREYLRRAALVAQALEALGLGAVSWPWFDAAACLTQPGWKLRLVPDVATGTLPGYALLDSAPTYSGPGADPLEDEAISVFRELGGRQLTTYMRDTCLFYVRWEALKCHPAVRELGLPDLYEPLIRFYERGGWFRMEHGDYIDLGIIMVGKSSPASAAQYPALASLDTAALDKLDCVE